MRPNNPDIGEDGLRELREIRLRRGLSQADLSAKTGVAEFTISEIESGKRANPRPSTLRKLAQALDVEVADLYGSPEHPLAEAPPSPEQPPLNGFEERRAPSLRNWTALVNALTDRWDQEITERENERQAVSPTAKKFVKWLPNLNWGVEIRRTAADLWHVATEELEASLGVYTSDEARELYRALRKLDGVIDRTDDWYSRVAESEPEGATIHDITEAAELRAARKATLERTGRRLGAGA